MLLCWNSYFITFTKLYYLRVRHVRQESGEWRAGSKPWKGRVNFDTRSWEKLYLQKGSKGVFWGSARMLHLIEMWVPSFRSSGEYLLQTQHRLDEADQWRPRPLLQLLRQPVCIWNDSQLWEKSWIFAQQILNFDKGWLDSSLLHFFLTLFYLHISCLLTCC